MKKTLLFFVPVCVFTASLLSGCSGGGDKDEMAPLSDQELLERGKAGRNQGSSSAPGAPGPLPGTPGASGGPERPGGR